MSVPGSNADGPEAVDAGSQGGGGCLGCSQGQDRCGEGAVGEEALAGSVAAWLPAVAPSAAAERSPAAGRAQHSVAAATRAQSRRRAWAVMLARCGTLQQG